MFDLPKLLCLIIFLINSLPNGVVCSSAHDMNRTSHSKKKKLQNRFNVPGSELEDMWKKAALKAETILLDEDAANESEESNEEMD